MYASARTHAHANAYVPVAQQPGMHAHTRTQLPRKFNVAVSGSRDDYAHTHINDIGFQPHVHAKTGASPLSHMHT